MRLAVPTPTGWTAMTTGDLRVAFCDDAVLAWGPLAPRPDDEAAAWRLALSAELPAGARLRPGAVARAATVTGWPVALVRADVVGDDGDVLELRLLAAYDLLELGGLACVRAASEARLAEARAALLAAVASPDDDPLTIRDLYDLKETIHV